MSKGRALRGLVLLVSAFGCGSSNPSAPDLTTGSGGGAGHSGAGSTFGAPPVGGSPVPITGAAGAAGTTGAAGTGGGAACAGDPLTRCTGTMSGPWCAETVIAGNSHLFSALWANRPDDVWFVGGQFPPGDITTLFGMFARFDGCAWTVTPRPDLPRLTGVWGAAPNDVWMVGTGGNAYHWNGSALTAVRVPGATIFNSVSGTSGNDVWAVGTGIFHWNGSAWAQSFAMAGSDIVSDNADIWAVAPNDVWVASGARTALHFNGTTWTGTPLTDFGLFSIWGDGRQAYAAGEGEAIFYFSGGTWTTLQPRGGSSLGFTDIGGQGTDIFTVGNAKVVMLSGATFAPVTGVPSDPSGTFTNVWVSPTQVWLGTPNGFVARRAR
jgi:hypothetical protein